MAGGGIHDRVGGGFHRYSVDERWHEPHYEKMLYDQAQLALSYLEAFELCGEEFFADVARDILDYVLRDMTDAGGGFYSAEDADSAYYQIPTIEARAQRPRPHRDDKILTAWNGLMISAFAVAAGVLNEPRYLAAARAAASFVLSHLCDTQSGRLWRRFRQEEAAVAGFLDDYAFFTQGLLDLCEATLDPAHLASAQRLTDTQRELFEDRERGGFYSTSGEDNSLVLRLKDGHDGAEPSGNSVAALNLLRLAQITGRGDLRESMQRIFAAFGAELSASPAALPAMLVALGHSLGVPLPARIGARHNSGGSMERPGAVTLKGNPLTLIGPELHVGDKAPDFDVVDKTLSAVNLAKTGGTVRIFSVVPSLDTPVCDAQTKRFNDETAKLPGVAIVTVSMDLPFAQARWCGAFGVDRVMMLSDHKNGSFGTNYGTLIKELRIESRAIFVVDQAGVIRHVEYVKEVADHPDYEATLKAARALVV
jgi:peroxiredoxin